MDIGPALNARRRVARAAALLAPPRCLACGAPVAPAVAVCRDCGDALAAMPPGRSVASPAGHFAAFPMAGPARALVHALKYRSAPAAAAPMARMIVERAPPVLLANAALVPVPAHPARQRRRGYNQTAVLAREISRLTGGPVCDCLQRGRSAPPQTGQSRERRLKLDPAAFRTRPRPLDWPQIPATFPTNVLLLDDVSTTGVTLEVCAITVRRRFGSEVRALTFASAGAVPGKSIGRCRKLG